MRKKLIKTEARLVLVESAFLVALLAMMVTLAFAQVILRHFGLGLLWAEVVLKNLVLWTGFLGAALAAASEKNFAWEAPHLGAPALWKPWLRLSANLSGAAITGCLLKAALIYLADERAAGAELLTIGGMVVHSWIAAAGIPIGFALLLMHLVFKSADAILEAAGQ